jgi:hypothetical protein
MKHLRYIFPLIVLLFSACDPNKELYEMLDSNKQPYRKAIEYTLVAADYSAVGGRVGSIQAFTDEVPAMNYVPAMLARKFIALNLGSSAMINFNFLVEEPIWWQAGFGHEMTSANYATLGLTDAFTPAILAKDNLPGFLSKEFRNTPSGTNKNIIYNYREGATTVKNMDVFRFDGTLWKWISTTVAIPFVGYELTADDYKPFGGNIAGNAYFSDAYPANTYMPVWLKNKYPYAISGQEQVVKYKYLIGGYASDVIDHYTFDGANWNKSSNIIQKTEQYVYGMQGWAFDPTTRFIMTQSDYMFLAVNDPIPHAIFRDFGYYYGASAFYSNFDMRLAARRTAKNTEGQHFDAALGAIFDTQGAEAAVDEMFRRIMEEGIINLLQHKYPQAIPQSGGIDVHYIVGFETYNDNFSRSYLESEYRCIAPASGDTPPQFEFIDGPRQRQ